MYERIFDISKMIAKIDIMIFCNIAPHTMPLEFRLDECIIIVIIVKLFLEKKMTPASI